MSDVDDIPKPTADRPLPKITDFEDYRHFLKARYEFMKADNAKFSYRYLASRVGSTDNYFKYIFDGKKNISLDRAIKTAAAFKLNFEETQFLIFKIVRQSLSEPMISKMLEEILSSLKYTLDKLEKHEHSQAAHDYQLGKKNWIQTAIIEMVNFPDFKADHLWIKNRMVDGAKFCDEDFKTALEELLNAGILFIDESGKMRVKDRHMVDSDGMNLLLGRHTFFKQMCTMLSDFSDNMRKYRPHSNGMYMTAINAREDFEKVVMAQKEYVDKLIQISNESKNPDVVISLYATTFGITNL